MDTTKIIIPPAILFFFFFLLLHFSTAQSFPSKSSGDIEWWCRTMPHPEPCRYYLSHPSAPPHVINRSDFYKISVKVALDLSIHAQGRMKQLGARCNGEAEKTAWLDCWKLFGNTVLQLNRTLSPAGDTCTAMDAQTWLSAALTNLYTCNKGFTELKANSSFMQPVLRYNVSDLISNCLAINNASLNATVAGPSWVWAGRRRLMQASGRTDFVVAQDGSGNFRTIKEALDAAAALRRSRSSGRIVIRVKAGVYAENLQILSSLHDLTIAGDGKGKTIITGRRSVSLGYTTFSSPTVSVFGDGFVGTDITIRNTYGAGSQAVALLSGSDQSVFYRCSIEGYQDTLCVYTQRQFYRECDIYGTIDFIFGNAAVVIQNSIIFARTPQKGEANVITAQGRTDQNQNTGIVIQSSTIQAAADFKPVHRTVKSYLGRPWQLYSRTVYLENFMDSIIDPAGWLPFNGNFALDTLYYAEFQNTGPGARVLRLRVKWKGFHIIRKPSQVRQFTVGNFIDGGTWLPATGVPFASGL
ncbi:pectinesterase 2-like [Dendrobium catenatum]|uniref:Pectinesterase n=1 Tax=Dendrobium catenatum TaxID=906689 RepID=A0A2I0WTX7_9ASPA|nr:pectinesterase 2-like [Dendrobium catenatum]PKU79110.1 Pectinesterase 2 [Dendrobium catenatum]